MYTLEFEPSWKTYMKELVPDIQKRVWKKVEQIENGLPGRHLQSGLDFFVEEVGQYRICYKSDEKRKVRRLYFVGKHKDYEKWIGIKK